MFVLIFFSHSVPQPAVSVSLNYTGLLFAGTGLIISCTVTLDYSVNNNERVTIHWSSPDHIPPERYSVSSMMRRSNDNSYNGRLTISTLADEDNGTSFTCTGIVTGGNETHSTSNITLDIEGEHMECMHINSKCLSRHAV